ncbi:MAG: hypothetical protein ACR2ND_09525 [Solirubrobacteraceae bacterium]
MKCSEHGLGHLLNPTDPDEESRDWIKQLWDYIVRSDALDLPVDEPPWLDRPALSRTTLSTPRLLRPFERGPGGGAERPFNFLLVAHVAPLGHPVGADPERFLLAAPYNTDARQWRKLAWTDTYTGNRYRITTTGQTTAGTVRVKTYRDVLNDYRTHSEPKSLAADGAPCDRSTVGLLGRRPVRALTITHIGKEANRLEDQEAGLVHDLNDVLTEYRDPKHDPFETLVRPVLREIRVCEVAAAAGVSERTIKAAGAGTRPRAAASAALIAVAADYSRSQLLAAGSEPPPNDLAALAAYLDDAAPAVCQGCREPLTGRQQRWCSEVCRKQRERIRRGGK